MNHASRAGSVSAVRGGRMNVAPSAMPERSVKAREKPRPDRPERHVDHREDHREDADWSDAISAALWRPESSARLFESE